jgi:two-component system response regulator FixJ
MLLESSGFAVCTHDRAEAFLSGVESLSGCVLTDLRMPGIDGLELQRRLRERGIQVPVIVMTGVGDVGIAVRAMKTGAIDFLEKPFADEALFDAVGRALEESERLRTAATTAREAEERLAALTPREREVLDLLVEGLPNKAIANALGTSPRTIEVHRARVLEKLRSHSLPDLMRVVLAARSVGGA